MSHYKHLTPEEREKILILYTQEYSISSIAKRINRNKSTVSRELSRNAVNGVYSAVSAQVAYEKRRMNCKPLRKLTNAQTYDYVKEKFLHHQWSPEQISGRMKYEAFNHYVSYSTIYRAIYAGMFDTKKQRSSNGNRGAIRKLRHRGKSRHTKDYVEKRGKIPISHLISGRPDEANHRSRLGDWEADTIIGAKGKDRACLVTLVDRKSRFLIVGKASAKKATPVGKVIINGLKEQPCCSITPDRGKEFASHPTVSAALDAVKFYFPLPHHPWQRGTNENTNGLLREYFPKGFDFADLSDEYIQDKVNELNKRPRKCLGYRTPYEVYYSTALHLT